MNRFKKIIRSFTGDMSDGDFESYYGMIVRNQTEGGPSAAEARRDYTAVREAMVRTGMF
ncbi:MAG: hypothetical protein M9890_01675 [Thermomicrobiales bacterium]|nr:hypothetical protein [Thermomicrobiales bacterium]